MNHDLPGPWIRRAWRYYRERRFAFLLGVLCLLVATQSVVQDLGLSAIRFEGLVLAVLLVVILSLCIDLKQHVFIFCLGIPSAMFSAAGYWDLGDAQAWIMLPGRICQIVFLFGVTLLIITLLFRRRPLTLDSILGAICGYIFLGIGWAVAYYTIESLVPGSFQINPGHEANEGLPSLNDALAYYSFVTLTTIGYGDVVPLTATTRNLAWVQGMTGQFYLAIIVASLVSTMVSKTHE